MNEGELGERSPGAVGDVAVWKLGGPAFAGAVADPVEAWLRCGPSAAWCTAVHCRRVVDQGRIVHPGLPEVHADHTRHTRCIQRL